MKALELYPSIRQSGLIEKARNFSLDGANTMYMPRLTLSGKASYQSEVTAFPLSLPGVSMEEMSKDQYQILLDLNQPLWDGGRTSSRKQIINASSQVDRKILDVELYSLKSRVNQIYFGILLLEEQLKQNALLIADLATNYTRVLSLYNFGMAKASDLDTLRVEQLKAEQTKTDLAFGISSYRMMLSQITGIPLGEGIELSRPETAADSSSAAGFKRPEMILYQAQKETLEAQKEMIRANTMPRLNAFVQGGYGRPGLNMLDNSFSPFYLTGIRLNWSLDSFYTKQSDMKSLEIEKQRVETREETFLYNTGLQISSQVTNIERLKQQIQKDDEIILLRRAIKKNAEIQLENGTMTVNDLIKEITEENLAQQKKSLHEIQMLQTQYDLNFTSNE
ncbi:TolC family protein [Oceanispirochaeta sp.]|uniref:TolC family protein n=1 Tax=Oceanispirochaeta sp. TaxID=2035350 RepID=UPI002637AA53|nr:TolC family protein [Oceanispirochaeta sp.]MDA3955531.1 TolC family protein [Oceanispirochaeta sp.]